MEKKVLTPHQIEMPFTGRELARAGAKLAEDHANDMRLGWGDDADDYFEDFLHTHHGEFMVEQVREFAYKRGLDRPPSERSWAGVVVRASNLGLIRKVGYRSVKNPRAHATPASVWQRVM